MGGMRSGRGLKRVSGCCAGQLGLRRIGWEEGKTCGGRGREDEGGLVTISNEVSAEGWRREECAYATSPGFLSQKKSWRATRGVQYRYNIGATGGSACGAIEILHAVFCCCCCPDKKKRTQTRFITWHTPCPKSTPNTNDKN